MSSSRRHCAKIAAIMLLVVAATGVAGCASGPKMSGFGVGDMRFVAVGEVVELQLPLRPDGSRLWRVTSYDSRYLGLLGAPQVVERGGRLELLVRARAKAPGDTEVEVTEQPVPGQTGAPAVVRFKVSIRPA